MIIIKKGQIWSYDILIAVGVFVVAFIGFYSLISFSSPTIKTAALSGEGSAIASASGVKQQTSNVSFIIDNSISPLRLGRLSNKDYNSIKSELGLRNDFCLHFEDEDGNLINITSMNYKGEISGIAAVGSSKITLTLEGIKDEIISCG